MDTETLYLMQDVLIAIVTVVAAVLFSVGFYAYSRTHNRKLLLVSLAFGLFLAKGVVLTYAMYTGVLDSDSLPVGFVKPFDMMLGFDLVILVVLYLAVMKR